MTEDAPPVEVTRAPIPVRIALAAAILVGAFAFLSVAWPAALQPLVVFAVVAAALLLIVAAPPLRVRFSAEWELAATSSPSAARRAQALSYLAGNAARLPAFAKDALPDVLVRATFDAEPSVRWQAMASAVRAAPHLPGHGRFALLEALLAAASRDAEASVRSGAARAVAAVVERAPPDRESHLADRLASLVADADPGVVASWCDVLPRVLGATGEAAPPALIETLLRLTASDEPVIRWSARRGAASAGALATPAGRAPLLQFLLDESARGEPKSRIDALEDLMSISAAIDGDEAVRVRAHLEAHASEGDSAVAGFALLTWAVAVRPGQTGRSLPQGLESAAALEPPLVEAARSIASSQAALAAGVAVERLEINRSGDAVVSAVAQFESSRTLARRLARASVRAAFPLLAGATRAALIGALLDMHAKDAQPARTNASAALIDIRDALTDGEVRRVAEALVRLMSGGHEAVRRQATVTAVGLMPRAPPDASASLRAALRSMAQDADPVVADQAKDSLMALAGSR